MDLRSRSEDNLQVVSVLDNRIDDGLSQQPGSGAFGRGIEGSGADITVSAFADRPTVIALPADQIDGFPKAFGGTADEQIASAAAVEGNSKWIAKAPGKNLVAAFGFTAE